MPVIPLVERSATPPKQDSDGEPPAKRVRPRALPELGLVVGLFLIYKVGRVIADGHVGRAFHNAATIWHAERWLRLPSETSVQHALLHSEALVKCANCYYAWIHFPVSAALLLWLYVYRPSHYIPVRRLMAVVTGIALAVHMMFPLAPPRMIPAFGMIDTAGVYGPSVYTSPSTDTLSNQYAAMPSLHVGWALIAAIGFIVASRTRWRWLWTLYPVATFAVVVGTANHYWVDGLVGAGMVALVAPLPGILRRTRPVVMPDAEAVRDVQAVAARSGGRSAERAADGVRAAIDGEERVPDPVPAALLTVWM